MPMTSLFQLLLSLHLKSLYELLCEQYSETYNLKFNTDKSKLMSFFNERININVNNINVKLNCIKIENITSNKHLGVEIVNRNSLTDLNSKMR